VRVGDKAVRNARVPSRSRAAENGTRDQQFEFAFEPLSDDYAMMRFRRLGSTDCSHLRRAQMLKMLIPPRVGRNRLVARSQLLAVHGIGVR
jgi:hypothetical protein